MRLKELRKNISQQKVSNDLGISQKTYSTYETGTRQADYETLIKLADYFHVSLDYLLGRDFDKKKEASATTPRLRKDEEYLLDHYNDLTQDQKEMILQSVTLFYNSNNNNRQNNDIADLFL